MSLPNLRLPLVYSKSTSVVGLNDNSGETSDASSAQPIGNTGDMDRPKLQKRSENLAIERFKQEKALEETSKQAASREAVLPTSSPACSSTPSSIVSNPASRRTSTFEIFSVLCPENSIEITFGNGRAVRSQWIRQSDNDKTVQKDITSLIALLPTFGGNNIATPPLHPDEGWQHAREHPLVCVSAFTTERAHDWFAPRPERWRRNARRFWGAAEALLLSIKMDQIDKFLKAVIAEDSSPSYMDRRLSITVRKPQRWNPMTKAFFGGDETVLEPAALAAPRLTDIKDWTNFADSDRVEKLLYGLVSDEQKFDAEVQSSGATWAERLAMSVLGMTKSELDAGNIMEFLFTAAKDLIPHNELPSLRRAFRKADVAPADINIEELKTLKWARLGLLYVAVHRLHFWDASVHQLHKTPEMASKEGPGKFAEQPAWNLATKQPAFGIATMAKCYLLCHDVMIKDKHTRSRMTCDMFLPEKYHAQPTADASSQSKHTSPLVMHSHPQPRFRTEDSPKPGVPITQEQRFAICKEWYNYLRLIQDGVIPFIPDFQLAAWMTPSPYAESVIQTEFELRKYLSHRFRHLAFELWLTRDDAFEEYKAKKLPSYSVHYYWPLRGVRYPRGPGSASSKVTLSAKSYSVEAVNQRARIAFWNHAAAHLLRMHRYLQNTTKNWTDQDGGTLIARMLGLSYCGHDELHEFFSQWCVALDKLADGMDVWKYSLGTQSWDDNGHMDAGAVDALRWFLHRRTGDSENDNEAAAKMAKLTETCGTMQEALDSGWLATKEKIQLYIWWRTVDGENQEWVRCLIRRTGYEDPEGMIREIREKRAATKAAVKSGQSEEKEKINETAAKPEVTFKPEPPQSKTERKPVFYYDKRPRFGLAKAGARLAATKSSAVPEREILFEPTPSAHHGRASFEIDATPKNADAATEEDREQSSPATDSDKEEAESPALLTQQPLSDQEEAESLSGSADAWPNAATDGEPLPPWKARPQSDSGEAWPHTADAGIQEEHLQSSTATTPDTREAESPQVDINSELEAGTFDVYKGHLHADGHLECHSTETQPDTLTTTTAVAADASSNLEFVEELEPGIFDRCEGQLHADGHLECHSADTQPDAAGISQYNEEHSRISDENDSDQGSKNETGYTGKLNFSVFDKTPARICSELEAIEYELEKVDGRVCEEKMKDHFLQEKRQASYRKARDTVKSFYLYQADSKNADVAEKEKTNSDDAADRPEVLRAHSSKSEKDKEREDASKRSQFAENTENAASIVARDAAWKKVVAEPFQLVKPFSLDSITFKNWDGRRFRRPGSVAYKVERRSALDDVFYFGRDAQGVRNHQPLITSSSAPDTKPAPLHDANMNFLVGLFVKRAAEASKFNDASDYQPSCHVKDCIQLIHKRAEPVRLLRELSLLRRQKLLSPMDERFIEYAEVLMTGDSKDATGSSGEASSKMPMNEAKKENGDASENAKSMINEKRTKHEDEKAEDVQDEIPTIISQRFSERFLDTSRTPKVTANAALRPQLRAIVNDMLASVERGITSGHDVPRKMREAAGAFRSAVNRLPSEEDRRAGQEGFRELLRALSRRGYLRADGQSQDVGREKALVSGFRFVMSRFSLANFNPIF